jgi:hypothetical protein
MLSCTRTRQPTANRVTIIRDYFIEIRDYFTEIIWNNRVWWSVYMRLCAIILRLLAIIFKIIFLIISDYTRLYFCFFTIISRRQQPENGNMQTAILDPITEKWLVIVDKECLLICNDSASTRRRTDRMDPALLNTLFFLLYALFFLAEQDWRLCKYVLRTVFLCKPILSVTTSLWNIGEAAVAVESARTVTIIRDYFAVIHYSCDYYFNYTISSTTKSRSWGWNSLQITGQSHHPYRKNCIRSMYS